MLINETKGSEMEALKEVKIRIPLRSYIRLRSMKVLTGKQISDAVNEALDAYFSAARAGKETPVRERLAVRPTDHRA